MTDRGFSSFARQTALLLIMAQMGSFVPATQLRFSPVDAVYTRYVLVGISLLFVATRYNSYAEWERMTT